MKDLLYATIAAGLAMFSTSAIIALATLPDAPPAPSHVSDVELVAQLDADLARGFARILNPTRHP